MSSQVLPFCPIVSTTNVSLSQWPIEYPIHVGCGFFGKRPPVREDLPVDGAGFVQEQRQVLGLHQLEAVGDVVLLRNAGRQTGHAGVILAVVRDALIVDVPAPTA